jgi:hypothetical protein
MHVCKCLCKGPSTNSIFPQRDQVQPRLAIPWSSDIRRHYKTISSNKFTLALRTVTAFFHTLSISLPSSLQVCAVALLLHVAIQPSDTRRPKSPLPIHQRQSLNFQQCLPSTQSLRRPAFKAFPPG